MIPAQGSCQWFGFSSLIPFFLMLRLPWVSNMQLIRSEHLQRGWEILPSLMASSLASINQQMTNDNGGIIPVCSPMATLLHVPSTKPERKRKLVSMPVGGPRGPP